MLYNCRVVILFYCNAIHFHDIDCSWTINSIAITSSYNRFERGGRDRGDYYKLIGTGQFDAEKENLADKNQ